MKKERKFSFLHSLFSFTNSLSFKFWGFGIDLCLFVPCFPAFFDLLISLGQGTQGNKGRKGISLALVPRVAN